MEITIQKDKLAKALNYVSRSVSIKPNIPVLSNVLLEVEKGVLKLSGTNLDMGMTIWVAGQVKTDGKTTISARYFSDFISAAPGEKVQLKLDDNLFTAKTEISNAQFQTISADEFPILPKVEGEPMFSIDAAMFVESLEKVIFACSTDSTPGRLQQTGVYISADKENSALLMVGLDGYRLSEKRMKIKKLTASEFTAIVPAKSLQELVKILQSESEIEIVDVYLNTNNSQLLFKFNEVVLSVRLLEGPYLEYKKAIPQEFEHKFEIDKNEFAQAIKVANTFARSLLGNRTNVDVDPDSGKMKLSTSIVDLGANETEVNIFNPEGGELKSAYNLKYLADMVDSIEGEKISLETKNSLSAAVFRDEKDPDYLHLIMPLKREN